MVRDQTLDRLCVAELAAILEAAAKGGPDFVRTAGADPQALALESGLDKLRAMLTEKIEGRRQ